jgi:hypothetical protein
MLMRLTAVPSRADRSAASAGSCIESRSVFKPDAPLIVTGKRAQVAGVSAALTRDVTRAQLSRIVAASVLQSVAPPASGGAPPLWPLQ